MKKLNSEKTIYSLKQAMIELLSEKAYSQISITDVTTKANLNRTTFYMFFSSKKDLLINISEDLLYDSEQFLQEFFDAAGDCQRRDIILKIYKYNTKRIAEYRAMFDIDENFLCFFDAYEETIKKTCEREIDRRYPQVNRTNRLLYCEWFTASLVSTFRVFIREELQEVEELADLILICLERGFDSILQG